MYVIIYRGLHTYDDKAKMYTEVLDTDDGVIERYTGQQLVALVKQLKERGRYIVNADRSMKPLTGALRGRIYFSYSVFKYNTKELFRFDKNEKTGELIARQGDNIILSVSTTDGFIPLRDSVQMQYIEKIFNYYRVCFRILAKQLVGADSSWFPFAQIKILLNADNFIGVEDIACKYMKINPEYMIDDGLKAKIRIAGY